MPELPEVETERTRIEPVLVGRTLRSVEILDERLTRPADPRAVAGRLEGEPVVRVERRGKYLVIRLESGDALLVHLRMTGGFRCEPVTHERARIDLDDGTRISFRDVRRFGTWQIFEADELDAFLAARLGPEPLGRGLSTAYLQERLAGRRAPVKALLLDQRIVAGLGNIYADEALWRARIRPLRPGGELTLDEVRVVRRGVRDALREGISRQGATLGDGAYAGGRMQEEFTVYGRDGEPCQRCGTLIVKTRAAGRGTHYCPVCQR